MWRLLLVALVAVAFGVWSRLELQQRELLLNDTESLPCNWTLLEDALFVQDALDVASFDVCSSTQPKHLRQLQRLVECRRALADGPLSHSFLNYSLDSGRLVRLLDAIAISFPARSNRTEKGLNVVIIGGGPVGLMSALQSRELPNINSVSVIERRSEYTRDAWVDISLNRWYSGLKKLEQWGGTLFNSNEHWFSSTNIILRTNMLEKMLAKITFLAGQITFLCETEPRRLCEHHGEVLVMPRRSTPTSVSQGLLPSCEVRDQSPSKLDSLRKKSFYRFLFDVLFGCEGSSGSWMRDQLNLGQEIHTRVSFPMHDGTNITLKIDNLLQTTMIVRYTADPSTGNCPVLRDGGDIDPYDITFSHPNITAAFKRWYRGHCQLQLIVSHQYGQELLQREDKIDWEMLLSVTNQLFATPVHNVTDLLTRLRPRSSKHAQKSTTDVEVDVVPIKIRTTSTLAKALNNNRAIAAVFGDNAINAHYRLGIGINQAFNALSELKTMLLETSRMLDASQSLLDVALAQHQRASERVQQMAQYQLRSIVLEAYCGFVLGADFAQPSLWHSSRVFLADRTRRKFVEVGQAADGKWGAEVINCLRRYLL